MKKQNRKQGFTLVELLVVIAILAILATVSIVGHTAFIKKAHQSNANAEANQVLNAIRAELISGDELVIGKVAPADNADGETTTYTLRHGTESIVIEVETTNKVGETITPVKKSTHTIALNDVRAYTLTSATSNWVTDKYVAAETADTLPATLEVSENVKALAELDGALAIEFDADKNVLSLVYTYTANGVEPINVRINLNDLETLTIVEEATPAA